MATPSPVEVVLGDSWFGSGIRGAGRSKLAALARVVEIPAHTIVVAEGGRCDELGVVIEGRLALRMRTPGGHGRTILTIDPGDVYCWSALLEPSTATSTVVATEATRAIVFDGQQLRSFLRTDIELCALVHERILAALGRRLVATRLQLLDLYGRIPEAD